MKSSLNPVPRDLIAGGPFRSGAFVRAAGVAEFSCRGDA